MAGFTVIGVVTSDFIYRGRDFAIVKGTIGDGQIRYGSIEHKYIGSDGRLTRVLNGVQMNLGESISDCLERTKLSCDVDAFAEQNGCKPVIAYLAIIMNMDIEEATRKAKEAGLI